MILQVKPKDIFEYLGHDGSAIIWPELDDPERRRSFHIQEIVDYALTRQTLLVPIEPLPVICPRDEWSLDKGFQVQRKEPFENILFRRPGVLLGEIEGRRHAVAWDRKQVHDPVGQRYGIEDFVIHVFYAAF